MLTVNEIKQFLDEDAASEIKRMARVCQNYYEGRHDILDYRLFYYNADGILTEDTTRSNAKIPHQFYTELVDQATEYILSGDGGIFHSDDPALQEQLDEYFNDSETFISELAEVITGQQAKGFDYLYAYKGENDRLCFEYADSLGIVEVEGRFADDGKDQIIYRYIDRVDKEGRTQFRIRVIDDEKTYFYKQTDDGEITSDTAIDGLNPRPHALYVRKDDTEEKLFTREFGFLPVFRLDNNRKKTGLLKAVKALIDDYDLMASSLTNNLVDFDVPIHVVKGFEGDTMEELMLNLKTRKIIGMEATDAGAGVDIKTIDVPYQARVAKLELDEKGIYHFGMGLNLAGLKDTTATTNLAIKAAYSLLDLRCKKAIREIKKFLRKILKVVLDEINDREGTDYRLSQVWFDFTPQTITNGQENAQIELTEAQTEQTRINTLLSMASYLGDELLMQNICDVLDIDYEEIKGKLPDPSEAENSLIDARKAFEGIDASDIGSGVEMR
ncbi:MAG: phage portal protein [Firmicutes bacterium]|nr:phage portal protein [Bacillota bacterium]